MKSMSIASNSYLTLAAVTLGALTVTRALADTGRGLAQNPAQSDPKVSADQRPGLKEDKPLAVSHAKYVKLTSSQADWQSYLGVYPAIFATAHSFQPAITLQVLSARKTVWITDRESTDTSQKAVEIDYTRQVIRDLWGVLPAPQYLKEPGKIFSDGPRLYFTFGLTTGSIKTPAEDVSNLSSVFVGVGYALNPYFNLNVGLLAGYSSGGATQRLCFGISLDPAVLGSIFK